MESRKMILMNRFAGHQWRCRHSKETCGYGRRKETEMVGQMERVHGNIYITICKTDSQWEFSI